MKNAPLPPHIRDEIQRLRMFGASYGEIARRLGVGKTSAFRVACGTPVVCSQRRQEPENERQRYDLVPVPGGGFSIVRTR